MYTSISLPELGFILDKSISPSAAAERCTACTTSLIVAGSLFASTQSISCSANVGTYGQAFSLEFSLPAQSAQDGPHSLPGLRTARVLSASSEPATAQLPGQACPYPDSVLHVYRCFEEKGVVHTTISISMMRFYPYLSR